MTTVQGFLDFFQRIVDVHPAQLVIPTISGGQAHPIQQEAIQKLGIYREMTELLAGDEEPGDAVIAELLGFGAVEVREA